MDALQQGAVPEGEPGVEELRSAPGGDLPAPQRIGDGECVLSHVHPIAAHRVEQRPGAQMVGEQEDLVVGDEHCAEELAAATQRLRGQRRRDRGAGGQAQEACSIDRGPPCTKMRGDGQHGLLVGGAPERGSS